MRAFPLFLATLAVSVRFSSAADILFFFGLASKSHQISAYPLATELANRGHHVTFISPWGPTEPHPDILHISIKGLNSILSQNEDQKEILKRRANGLGHVGWNGLSYFGLETCKILLEAEEMSLILNDPQPTFDLIIIDSLFNDCGYGFAWKYHAPVILFGTSSIFPWFYDSFGHSPEITSIPDMQMNYPMPMTLLDKMSNFWRPILWHLERKWRFLPELEQLLRGHAKLNLTRMPPIEFMEKEWTALVLVNSYPSYDFSYNLPPQFIRIGGIHCRETLKPLEKQVEEFLNGADVGAVLISFGSIMRMSNIPEETKNTFLQVLNRTEFKGTRFLWKWDGPLPVNLPHNVMTVPWTDQQSILGHPNVKGFISHGGLLSLHEAIYHAVPVILFPLFAEQNYNAQMVHGQGFGVSLEISAVTEVELSVALRKILFDSSIKNQMGEQSKWFKDRPEHPLQTAVFWTEFVLRNGKSKFLKPSGVDQNWLERRGLDLIAFTFILISLSCILIVILIVQLCHYFKNQISIKHKVKSS